MRLFLCSTVLATVLVGALAYPTDQKLGEPEKQPKQSLFGLGIDLNISKNGTLIPSPAFINTSASYGTGIGAGGNFLVPLMPFPLGLLFPNPPLNITVGFNANKNISAALVASTGNATIDNNEGWGWPQAPPSGWGWSTTTQPSSGWGWTTTTPPPSGWGPPPTTSGWGPPPTTPGWSPPPTTSGWSPPPTTQGWGWDTTTTTTTTPGWGWEETTTPGWSEETTTPGWGWGVRKGSAAAADKKPQNPQNSGPKPNSYPKPAPEGDKVEAGQPAFISNVAQSSQSSELPAEQAPAQIVLENNELSAAQPAVSAQQAYNIEPLADVKIPAPASPAGKSKRHAGVQRPSALRIEDFDDVESHHEAPASPMQEEQSEVSKEEMIIMAMEQSGQQSRPAPRPTLNQLQVMNKPSQEDEDDSSRESSEAAKPISKVKPETEGRHKPRPYGMDKPSKNRPNLDSNPKDKVEFGLPHYSSDYIQKEQFQLPIGSTVLGWQVPDIKWSSFATIFQNFLGSRHRKNQMGRDSASSEEKCIDEEEVVRSPVIQAGHLCQASTEKNSCHQACLSNGFAGGNCLGPHPTPGCLCRMPNHKEYGMMLSPIKKAVDEEVLEISSSPCKKCACAESCKASGSYTGFCVDRCYCAVPWYTKEV